MTEIYTIEEDRTKARTTKEVLSNLDSLSFAEEVERSVERTAVMLSRPVAAREAGADKEVIEHESKAAEVYKRALILVGLSSATITDEDGNEKLISDNKLPVSSYLAHGSRMMVEIPPGTSDDLFNWLTSGDKASSGAVRDQSQKEAIKKGAIIYNRSAATHKVDFDTGKAVEKKGLVIGVKDFVSNLFGKHTKHWGVDLACDAEFKGADATGKIVSMPDGDHGHLYMWYQPPTKDRPGALLFGVEGAAPSSSKHSKIGSSDPLSPLGCSKFRDLARKKEISQEEELEGVVVPRKYNGMIARPSEYLIDSITSIDSSEFGTDVATFIPGRNLEEFKSGRFYVAPKKLPSREIEKPLTPKFYLFKKVVSIFSKYFREELKKFSDNKKLYNTYKKVSSIDSVRMEHPEGRVFKFHAKKASSLQAHKHEINKAQSIRKSAENLNRNRVNTPPIIHKNESKIGR